MPWYMCWELDGADVTILILMGNFDTVGHDTLLGHLSEMGFESLFSGPCLRDELRKWCCGILACRIPQCSVFSMYF